MRSIRHQRGFSTIELLATVGIMGVVAATAIPSSTRMLSDLRLRGDARGVHNAVALAKMRAAARYTRERIYVDKTTNSYHLQYWDKPTSTWADEVDPTVTLQSGVSFGYGAIATPPPNTQSSISQAPACTSTSGSSISGTSCIIFNSRGIPVDSSGSITGNSALYITDGTGIYGVTLSATPLVRLWWTKASSAAWVQR